MNVRNVFPGQRVVTSGGDTVTVAFVEAGKVYAYRNGRIVPVMVRCDAWGGEHDMGLGLAA
jgi:hypothetical protein